MQGRARPQVLWCNDPAHAARYLLCTDEHALLLGSFPAPAAPVAGEVLAAAWAPRGSAVAYTVGGSVHLRDAAAWGAEPLAVLDIQHPDGEPPEQQRTAFSRAHETDQSGRSART